MSHRAAQPSRKAMRRPRTCPADRQPSAAVQVPADQPWRPLSLRPTPTRRRCRTIALVVGVAALLAAGPLMLALSPHQAPPKLSAADRTVNEAAAWVAQQVSPNDVVSCDLAMCLALRAHGVSVGDLLGWTRVRAIF